MSSIANGFAVNGVDLTQFFRQKQEVEMKASQAISERIETITKILKEIKEISEATGVEYSIDEIGDMLSSMSENGYWNSSSY